MKWFVAIQTTETVGKSGVGSRSCYLDGDGGLLNEQSGCLIYTQPHF